MKKLINIILISTIVVSCGKIKIEPKKVEGDIKIQDSNHTVKHEVVINLDNIIDLCGQAYEENTPEYQDCIIQYSSNISDLLNSNSDSFNI